jgi:hypothetical protein
MDPYSQAISIMNSCGGEYVVTGGFAIVMYGFNRFTPDLNIVVDFDSDYPARLVTEFNKQGFEASPPLTLEGISDPAIRKKWKEEDNLFFYSLKDPQAPTFSVEIFLEHTVPYRELTVEVNEIHAGGNAIRMASLKHLVRLKQIADRGQDRTDIENLQLAYDLRRRQKLGESVEEILKTADTRSVEDMMSNIMSFDALSYDERLEWLVNMLTQLGQFCIF